MRILVTGGDGQLGRALQRRSDRHVIVALTRAQLDVTAPNATELVREADVDVVVNAAALTNVDGCEHDADGAFRINGLGARNVAVGAALAGTPVVQISTDYVFSGDKGAPYWEFDEPAPLSVYGASKLAGERVVAAVNPRHFIVRSAWLYGIDGPNFVTKILGLAAERPYLEVVEHEVGNPTFCDDLADGLLALVETRAFGVHHLVNEGWCSRRTFAEAIVRRGSGANVPVRRLGHYERPARPPSFAPLRNFAAAEAGIRLPAWEDGLDRFFERRAVVPA